MLPKVLKYERGLADFLENVNKGMVVCPDYHEQQNRPSLWTYYETLPAWCRDNPIVRQTLFAFEYNKPHMDIRQKELGLNFMASMLRPVEGRLKDVIAEVAYSNKIRINMTNGKEMMNELNMYTIDVAELGTDTEDDAEGEAANEKEFNRLLMGGGLDEEEALSKGDILAKVMHDVDKMELGTERA